MESRLETAREIAQRPRSLSLFTFPPQPTPSPPSLLFSLSLLYGLVDLSLGCGSFLCSEVDQGRVCAAFDSELSVRPASLSSSSFLFVDATASLSLTLPLTSLFAFLSELFLSTGMPR